MQINDLRFLKDVQYFGHSPLSASLFTWRTFSSRGEERNSACAQDVGGSNKMEAFGAYPLIRPTIRRCERPAAFHPAALPNSPGPPQPHCGLNSANPWPANRHIHPHALSQELIFILRGLAGARARKKKKKRARELLSSRPQPGPRTCPLLPRPAPIHNSDLSAAH